MEVFNFAGTGPETGEIQKLTPHIPSSGANLLLPVGYSVRVLLGTLVMLLFFEQAGRHNSNSRGWFNQHSPTLMTTKSLFDKADVVGMYMCT
ncbi:hypothetical protein QCA50_004209 [Cerrena zonata]|uniref:Uncharacterized protein n=1 Tax=Cerrena zonata TaxID=2478898 RepID=A0AAW0GL94_9APHY